jgi:uncharacterized protein (TIGR02266 family)
VVPTIDEKRAHPRFPLILAVDYPGGAAALRDYTENLSAGGLFVRTARDFRVGDVVSLVVSFPELLEPVELVTEVVWIRPEGKGGPQGVALWVPPERVHERGKLAELARAAGEAAAQGHPAYRVLLVEDNSLVAAMYTSALRRLSSTSGLAGFSIEVANDGSEALHRLRGRPPIDLVITDVYMPLMTGYALLEEMRADSRLVRIPVIVISGCGDSERERLTELGANFFLQKPVRHQDIVATVRTLLTAATKPDKEETAAKAPT